MAEEMDLREWIALVAKRWRFLGLVGLLCGLLTLGVVSTQPRWYQSTARILPPHEAPTPLLSAKGLEDALRFESTLPFSGETNLSDVFMGILESDTVARALIERFDLQTVYEQGTLVRTLGALRQHTSVAPDLNGTLTVVVEDKDPQRAADLANAYVEELERVYLGVRSTGGTRQREFLEARLQVSRARLDSLDAAMVQIQATGGVVTLTGDLRESANAAGELIGRRMAILVRLEMFDSMGVTTSPYRQELETELAALNREVGELPELGLEVARLLRDVRIQERLHEALAQQLEMARIEEVRDTPMVEILDPAFPADRHIRPRKGIVSVVGTLLGMALGMLWVAYSNPAREA